MKGNYGGALPRLLVFVLGCVLFAGCEDLIKGPPPELDPGDGLVVITIGSGPERTVFPRADQFSEIMLSFDRKDGEGSMQPVQASIGETVISLNSGTWEITASAYNAADPPVIVAQAKNTLTRDSDNVITGDTHFALAPAGTGPGMLRYTIVPPEGMVLDAAKSRIRIEKDGAVFADLNDEGFAAGVRFIHAAIDGGTVSLDPGRYVADILLDDNASVNAAVCIENVAILPGLVTELIFTPETGDFLDPNVLALLTDVSGVNFGRTKNNSSATVIGTAGGNALNKTQALSVPNGVEAVYFTLSKIRTQTITPGGEAAGKISIATGGTVDGSPASLTQAGVTVNTAAIAGAGGSLQFTLSLGENGKTPVMYTVTLNVAVLTHMHVKTWPTKRVYMIGDSFDPAGLSLWGIYSDEELRPVTEGYAITGFDSSVAGELFVQIKKHGVTANQYRTVNQDGNFYNSAGIYYNNNPSVIGIAIEVRSVSERALVFYHGLTADYEPMLNQYTVPNGWTVVLAPVKYHIPDNAEYEWKVDGATQSGYTTEYFPYTATSSSGEHTVRVAAKVNDIEIASGTTKVVCVSGASPRSVVPESKVNAAKLYAVVAPGQFDEMEGELYGAGGFGGYTVFKFDHSVMKKAGGEEILIGGNAFNGWQEPGAIWVSQDDNNDGLANDTWYELAGSHTLATLTLRRCAVTFRVNGWEDNFGNGGDDIKGLSIKAGNLGLTEITLAGTLLHRSYANAVMWGYADVNDNGRVSLSNAIQADGSSVDLAFIDFIKVVTALHFTELAVNERSTEARVPKDRGMPDPDKYISGSDIGDGWYEYTFENKSGYPLTIIFEGEEIALAQASGAPTTVVRTIKQASVFIDFYGGNVKLQKSTGLTSFVDG
jgi:hypothetical protein